MVCYRLKVFIIIFYLSCFYILTVHLECKSERCSFSSVANGEQIIPQLPKFLRCQYPGYMIHRNGISKIVGDLLRPCMQNSVGPQKVLRELHKLKHARSEFRYLNATIRQYFTNHNVIRTFSDFDDKNAYGGFIPSPQYFRSFYTSYIEEIRHLPDKQMRSLTQKILKVSIHSRLSNPLEKLTMPQYVLHHTPLLINTKKFACSTLSQQNPWLIEICFQCCTALSRILRPWPSRIFFYR